MACVTVAKFLSIVPELAAFGGSGSGSITFAGSTVALDTVTIGAAIGTATAGPRAAGTDTWSTDGAAQIEFYLDCACKMINPQCWGDKFECAVILIAAHLMTVASGGESGPVASKKIDKISVSYSATSFDSSDAAFSGTRYGRDYLAMRETLLVFPVVGTGLPRVWPRSFRRGRY